jgi:hypothetical protein
VYDKEGGLVDEMFEDMFRRWDIHGSGSLSAGELWRMVKRNRLAADPFGVSFSEWFWVGFGIGLIINGMQWVAAVFEFGTTWLMVQQDGRVSKEDLRGTYDVCDVDSGLVCSVLTATGEHLLEDQGG